MQQYWLILETILSTLYLCITEQLFITSFFVLKAHIVLNISEVVLKINNFTGLPASPKVR